MKSKEKDFSYYCGHAIAFVIDELPILLVFIGLAIVLFPCWFPIAIVMWLFKIPISTPGKK